MVDMIKQVINECLYHTERGSEFLLKVRNLIPQEERNAATLKMLQRQYRDEYVANRRNSKIRLSCNERLKAVFAWAMNFWKIDNRKEVFMEILEQDTMGVSLLGSIPEEEVTKNMVEKAVSVSKYGEELLFVPHRFLTEPLIMQAVKNSSGRALAYVPEKMRTKEMCQTALEMLSSGFFPLEDELIPHDILDEDMCLTIMKKWPQDIDKVPEKLKTEKVCLESVIRRNKGGNFYDGFRPPDVPMLNKMFSLYVDEGMNDFDAIVERLKTDNENIRHDQMSDRLAVMFRRCQKVFEHIPESHLSICKKMFSLYNEKEIPQDIDTMIEILQKMKEHQLSVEDSLAEKICDVYQGLKDKQGQVEKNIDKLLAHYIKLKKLLVESSSLFQMPIAKLKGKGRGAYTNAGESLSSIGVIGTIQEYLGVRNDDAPRLASTGQKNQKRIKNSPTGGEVEKTVWDKIIATGYFISEKILFSTPFSEKTRTGKVISSIWLVCVFALAVHCQVILPTFKIPLVLMPLMFYSGFKMYNVINDILSVAWFKFVIPKLSHSYYVERAGKEISASEFAKTEEFLGKSASEFAETEEFLGKKVCSSRKYYSWESIISLDDMKKQEEDERNEALGGQARSAFSTSS